MPDPFSALIPEARAFLAELADNNSRDWFAAAKPRYEAQLRRPAMLLLEQVAQRIGPGTGTKLFRPQRDLRFSKDKTPYHTHLHLLWTLPGDARQRPGLFFGIAPDYVSAGGGLMAFDKAVLAGWRAAADGPDGADIGTLLESYRSRGLRIGAPELKRVPAPHPQDHPRAGLLRRKSLTAWRDAGTDELSDPPGFIEDTYNALRPLFALLDRIA